MGGSMGDFKDLVRIMMTCQYVKSTTVYRSTVKVKKQTRNKMHEWLPE